MIKFCAIIQALGKFQREIQPLYCFHKYLRDCVQVLCIE